MAAEHGIDINNLPDDPDYDLKRKKKKELIKDHSLSRLSKKYASDVRAWLESNGEIAKKKRELILQAELGTVPENKLLEDVSTLKDCFEVIQWYLHFIYVKINRALSGKLEDSELDDDIEIQSDHNGSAKIASISIDRSISAWAILHQQLPDSEHDILNFLALLQKIKKQIESEFPDAQKFIRPGFDE